MALSAGTRVGPYEVLGAIGAGGMGEVSGSPEPRRARLAAAEAPRAHMLHADQPAILG